MCKRLVVVCYLTAATSLGAAAVGLGQTGERPLQKLFGGAAPKSSPAEDLRRRAEIDIELAWLADPITFPYFLEARLEGSTLSVRGYVPDKTVRAQALKLARLHTAYTIADMLKEHPSLLVRPSKETPAHLQTVAVATLKEALPKQYQRLQVQCAADGTVTLLGPVQSVEDKLAASLALRRLYGCTSVQNRTQLPRGPDLTRAAPPPPEKSTKPAPAPVAAPTGPSTTRPSPEPRIAFGLLVPNADAKPVTPPATKAPEPKVEPPKEPAKEPAPVVQKDERAKADGKLSLSAEQMAQLQKRVLDACPDAKNVKIEVTPMNKLQIELMVRSDDQISPAADKLYNVPELATFREALELHFLVGE